MAAGSIRGTTGLQKFETCPVWGAILLFQLFYKVFGASMYESRTEVSPMIQVPNSEFLFTLLSQFERQQIAADLGARGKQDSPAVR